MRDVDSFEVIANPTRRRLIELLSHGECNAGELVSRFGVSFSAISQQLRILSEANIVTARRDGRMQIYRLRTESMDPVAEWIARYAQNFWRKKLKGLGDVLGRMKDES